MPSELSELGRFTDVSLLILLSLASGPKHGYVIIEDIAQFSGTRFEPGTLYGALMRLERKGWIAALPADDRRHPYQLTGAGMEVLRQQIATLQQIVAVGALRLAPR
jgi:DNA-binding PadR family transcriptional regulator